MSKEKTNIVDQDCGGTGLFAQLKMSSQWEFKPRPDTQSRIRTSMRDSFVRACFEVVVQATAYHTWCVASWTFRDVVLASEEIGLSEGQSYYPVSRLSLDGDCAVFTWLFAPRAPEHYVYHGRM